MRFDEVKELIELINNSDLSYFEMRDDKEFIKMDKSITRNYISNSNDLFDNNLNKLAITDLSNDVDIKTEVKENIDFDEPESEFEGTVISDDADVQENHMIEEIEVDEDEDLLDDMSYDDFDYTNDDNDDYEM